MGIAALDWGLLPLIGDWVSHGSCQEARLHMLLATLEGLPFGRSLLLVANKDEVDYLAGAQGRRLQAASLQIKRA